MSDFFEFLFTVCFVTSIGAFVWAIIRSVRKRRSLRQYISSACFFALAIAFGMAWNPPADKTQSVGSTAPASAKPNALADKARSVGRSIVRTTASAAPTSAKPKARDVHANERLSIRAHWDEIMMHLAVARLEFMYADKFLHKGNTVGASSMLKDAIHHADIVKVAADAVFPDSWKDSVSSNLMSAGASLEEALSKMRDYLDTARPSDVADAADDFQQSNDLLATATHNARVAFVALGGKGSDIADIDSEQSAVKAGMDYLSNSKK